MSVQPIRQADVISDYDREVAAEVRGEAAKKQVTNRRLARSLGVSDASVSRRMNGHQPFTIGELAAVAHLLGVPVAALRCSRTGRTSRSPA